MITEYCPSKISLGETIIIVEDLTYRQSTLNELSLHKNCQKP